MKRQKLILSLHDVTVSTWEKVCEQVKRLEKWGATQVCLLVIPYYHARERIDESKEFVRWLIDQQTKGHEIVLHGWIHKNSESQGREVFLRQQTLFEFLKNQRWFYEQFYTVGEAEFFSLNFNEAKNRMERGITLFHELKLVASGFIPPAWLMNSEVERAAAVLGFRYTNTISEIVDLVSKQRYPTRSCVWSVRAKWRRECSRIWNAWLFKKLRTVDPLRISLHPNDFDYLKIESQIEKLVRQALEIRTPVTYAGWIDQQLSK